MNRCHLTDPLRKDTFPLRSLAACCLAVALLLSAQVNPLEAASPQPGNVRAVTRQEMLEAMGLQHGYDLKATTNAARFQAGVLLHLARQARARDPKGPPLFLGHADWFEAFLQVTGLNIKNSPQFALLSYRYRQDTEVDYCSDRVAWQGKGSRRPDLAANVRIWWPNAPLGPSEYSYEDTLSIPHLKATNHQLITYRLLDFGDMIVYDDIQGLTGRPTSGVLGLLFRVIGEGRVVESRMALSSDGLQVSRARAEKAFIEVTTTVTVYPDGRTEEDVPGNRPDLTAIEERLKQGLGMNRGRR